MSYFADDKIIILLVLNYIVSTVGFTLCTSIINLQVYILEEDVVFAY